MATFSPWRNVADLPEHAPIRRLRPDHLPRAPEVRRRLAAEGIDPESAAAVLSALLGRGWASWLIAAPGPPASFAACVLEPRYGAVWAEGRGGTPAEAYGALLVLCLDAPPWTDRPEDREPPRLAGRGSGG